MGQSRVVKEAVLAAPPARVFARISDHEAMSEWPGVSGCRLIQEGTPKNGVGAIREVRARGLTLHEEIVVFEPPNRMEYTIIKGLPVTHRGVLQLVEVPEGTHLTWTVEISSKFPGLAQVVGWALKQGLGPALSYVAKRVAEDEATADKAD